MKAVLFCNNSLPYLYANIRALEDPKNLSDWGVFFTTASTNCFKRNTLNGYVVAYCNVDAERLDTMESDCYGCENWDWLLEGACVDMQTLQRKISVKSYAIHLKDVHCYDDTHELIEFTKNKKPSPNMHYGDLPVVLETVDDNGVLDYEIGAETCAIIFINSEELCRILNKEQTMLIRPWVLKGILLDDELEDNA